MNLTLKVEEICDAAEDDSAVDGSTSRSHFEKPELSAEVISCVVNLDERIAIVTKAGRTRRDDLARAVRSRLEHFKRQTLQSVPQLVNHWAIAAFEDNILPISELIVLLRLVCRNDGFFS